MPVLYLMEHRSYVRKHGDRVRLVEDGKMLLEMPFERVDFVRLFGMSELNDLFIRDCDFIIFNAFMKILGGL